MKRILPILIFYVLATERSNAVELLLDENCEPAAISTRIRLALKNDNDVKMFWNQQAEALTLDMAKFFKNQEISDLSERQRLEENELIAKHRRETLAALSKEDYKLPADLLSRLDRTSKKTDEFIAASKSRMRESKIRNFVKCWNHAINLSK